MCGPERRGEIDPCTSFSVKLGSLWKHFGGHFGATLWSLWIHFEVTLESVGEMLSNKSSSMHVFACLQTNMVKSQISRVDIRIGKGGLDRSQTKNKPLEEFFHNKLL